MGNCECINRKNSNDIFFDNFISSNAHSKFYIISHKREISFQV